MTELLALKSNENTQWVKGWMMKTCSKCKKTFELSEFNKDCKRKDGKQTSCRTCKNQYIRQYRSKNRARHAAIQRRHKEKNKAQYKAKAAKYWIKNKNKIRQQRATRKVEIAIYNRLYYVKHYNTIREAQNARYRRVKRLTQQNIPKSNKTRVSSVFRRLKLIAGFSCFC